MAQKKLLCVIHSQFVYVHLSIHYNIQSIIVMQRNRQTTTHQHAPRPYKFAVEKVSKTQVN